MYKNIDKQTKLTLKELVEYQEGQVVSKTLVQNDYVSMTIFSFDKGEEISTHAAGGDAMVTVLEGKGRFTVGDEVFYVEEGETLIMPKDIPHAVYGEERFKMQLTLFEYIIRRAVYTACVELIFMQAVLFCPLCSEFYRWSWART